MSDDNQIIIDRFSWHEALDRTSLLETQVVDWLLKHPVIECNPELLQLATAADNALADLYQKIGEVDPYWRNK